MPELKITKVLIDELKPSTYNPRKWSEDKISQLTESIKKFGLIDPILVNSATERKNIVIGGHFRLKIAKDLGFKEVPVLYIDIPDLEKEKELNLRLNKSGGDWEQWVYGNPIYGANYVYFDNDIVTSIQN